MTISNFAQSLATFVLKSARRNRLSAYQHAGVIDVYLTNEVRLGCVVGPFDFQKDPPHKERTAG